MLYHLLYGLHEKISFLNVFRYITFRTGLSMLTALAVCLLFGPWFISFLQKKQLGQTIRPEGPASHVTKQGTPTMGGGLIIIALMVSTLLWADLSNPYVWLVLMVTAGYGLIGVIYEYKKIQRGNAAGLIAKTKFFWQTLIALLAGGMLLFLLNYPPTLAIPFFKRILLDL